MVAACGLPTTRYTAQVFISLYPPKPSQMNDGRSTPTVFVIDTMPTAAHPSRVASMDFWL
jgi:hypothetical protein